MIIKVFKTNTAYKIPLGEKSGSGNIDYRPYGISTSDLFKDSFSRSDLRLLALQIYRLLVFVALLSEYNGVLFSNKLTQNRSLRKKEILKEVFILREKSRILFSYDGASGTPQDVAIRMVKDGIDSFYCAITEPSNSKKPSVQVSQIRLMLNAIRKSGEQSEISYKDTSGKNISGAIFSKGKNFYIAKDSPFGQEINLGSFSAAEKYFEDVSLISYALPSFIVANTKKRFSDIKRVSKIAEKSGILTTKLYCKKISKAPFVAVCSEKSFSNKLPVSKKSYWVLSFR